LELPNHPLKNSCAHDIFTDMQNRKQSYCLQKLLQKVLSRIYIYLRITLFLPILLDLIVVVGHISLGVDSTCWILFDGESDSIQK